MRAAVRSVAVTALAVALLALFVRNADLTRVWTEMRAARADLLLLGVIVTVAMYFVRAERWQYLLEPLGPTRFWVAFRTTVIGFAVTMALPARVGEVLRPYLLARHERLPVTATFATIIVERILDLVAVLFLLGVYLVGFGDEARRAAPALYQAVVVGAAATGVVALATLVVMFVTAGHPERLHRVVLRSEAVLPPRPAHVVARLARTFAEGLAVVRRPSRLVLALGWSLVLWLLIAAYAWLVALAFGMVFPFVGSFLLSAILVVGVAVPTPGGVGGVHEAFRLAATSFFAAPNDTAVGAAIVFHGVNTAVVIAGGVWFALRDGLTMSGLKQMAAGARQAEAEVNP